MTLTMLADRLGGQMTGPDIEFSRLSTDTRTLGRGDAYLALSGENFNGNDFLPQAKSAGASAAIVVRGVEQAGLSCLQVDDTHAALGAIANENRSRSRARLIALTGSQGKTTVKEMLASILKLVKPTLVTEANLNNTIGVPLTLLQLEAEHDFAVIEMGANGAGEIDFSARVAAPDIVLITNASPAHLEGFGSLQGIVEAKGEIIDHLSSNGTAILNADDANVSAWCRRAGDARVAMFGLEGGAGDPQYRAGSIRITERGSADFTLIAPQGSAKIALRLLGRHNVVNAVAAAAAALEAGADLEAVAAGLASVQAVPGRLNSLPGRSGCMLIDDTYNASPGSFRAAIDVLMALPQRKILVAGDMRELGAESEAAHAEVGHYARQAGIKELLAVGESSRITAQAFGEGGRHFEHQEALLQACLRLAEDDVVFLVKGSRGARMDKIIKALKVEGEQ